MKKAVVAVSVLALLMLSAMSMSLVYATKPITVNGTRKLISATLEERRAGESDNIFVHLVAKHLWTGDIEGTANSDALRIYHNFPNGRINLHLVETLSSVKVLGISKSGELTIRLEAIVEAGIIEGTWVIIGGTDDVSNLHGQGTLYGSAKAASYSGQIHFDP